MPLAILKVNCCDGSNESRLGMTAGRTGLPQHRLDEVLSDSGLLLFGDVLPVFLYQPVCLDGGLLPNGDVCIGGDELDEEKEALGVHIVVLLKLGGSGLDF